MTWFFDGKRIDPPPEIVEEPLTINNVDPVQRGYNVSSHFDIWNPSSSMIIKRRITNTEYSSQINTKYIIHFWYGPSDNKSVYFTIKAFQNLSIIALQYPTLCEDFLFNVYTTDSLVKSLNCRKLQEMYLYGYRVTKKCYMKYQGLFYTFHHFWPRIYPFHNVSLFILHRLLIFVWRFLKVINITYDSWDGIIWVTTNPR